MGLAYSANGSLAAPLSQTCATRFLAINPATTTEFAGETERALALLQARKNQIAYPQVPSVDDLSICTVRPRLNWDERLPLSAGLTDPLLERARDLKVFEDFKILSDLRPRVLSAAEYQRLRTHSQTKAGGSEGIAERAFLEDFIGAAYEHPEELIPVPGMARRMWGVNSGDPGIDAAFRYTEETWEKLLRGTRPGRGGSLLPSPYPVLVPAGRFTEAYYWDSYFATKGLLATERLELAQMQVENFLSYVRRYGFVPNGGRDYYLSRSQPPFLSSMVREVFEASLAGARSTKEKSRLLRWLKKRAFPLLKLDYERFWMNKATRYDRKTGLNHHWDDINLPRPERHSADNELTLGKTYRDVRAGAESGLDFTDAFLNEPTRVAGPLLNSMLFKTEEDLAWIARQLDLKHESASYSQAAARRKIAMNQYLWNSRKGHYEGYHLDRKTLVGALSADTFAPLFVGAASPTRAARVRQTLSTLERPGGLMASNLTQSPHQWDGTNGWAPYQVMAIEGLNRYHYKTDAQRIARKWVDAVGKTYAKNGTMYERLDVATLSKPETDPHKYPTQEGFLWTNGAFSWAVLKVLGVRAEPLPP